ncbi:hypothetical protein M3899_003335 [Vibrio parahaemolyticus]|nr:hypothetical protein [Vibrio parahaemolyticus]
MGTVIGEPSNAKTRLFCHTGTVIGLCVLAPGRYFTGFWLIWELLLANHPTQKHGYFAIRELLLVNDSTQKHGYFRHTGTVIDSKNMFLATG